MSAIKTILVEDNPEYRQALSAAIQHLSELKLMGKFGTAEQALRKLQVNPHLAEILLLDLNLPKLSGLEALDWIKKYAPGIKVIVLTQSDDKEDVLTALHKGAAGYLLKSAKISQIKEAVLSAMKGGAPIDSQVAPHLIENVIPHAAPNKVVGDNGILSERELEVLRHLGDGLTKKEIAQQLNISTHTVNTHVRHIYEKMDVLNAPAAISKAYKERILS